MATTPRAAVRGRQGHRLHLPAHRHHHDAERACCSRPAAIGTLRVYDADTGTVLWTAPLPAGSRGIPAMYEVNGRQFFLVNASSSQRGAAGAAGAGACPPTSRSRFPRQPPNEPESDSGLWHRPKRARLSSATICNVPSASSPSRTARCGRPTPAAAWCGSPAARQELITQAHSDHFEQASSEASRYLEGTLPNGLAFARNGDILISNFGTDRLEVMSRDGRSHVLADSVNGKPVGQGQLRPARLQGSRLGHGVDEDHELDARAAARSRRRLSRPPRATARCASSPTASTSPTRSGSTPRKSGSTSSRRPADASPGCASTTAARYAEREIFGPSNLGPGAWPDGIAFDSSATCGARWSIRTSCSC